MDSSVISHQKGHDVCHGGEVTLEALPYQRPCSTQGIDDDRLCRQHSLSLVGKFLRFRH